MTVPVLPAVTSPVSALTDLWSGVGLVSSTTVISTLPDLSVPSVEVAVMTTLPAFFAVMTPLASTVAMDSSLDFHVTFLLVALPGLTVAVAWSVLPTETVVPASTVTSTLVTGTVSTGLAVTVMWSVPDTPPAVAVMVTVPAFLAVTTPSLSTVATDSSLDFHVTVLSVASAGATVAVRVVEAPSTSSCLPVTVTDWTGMTVGACRSP